MKDGKNSMFDALGLSDTQNKLITVENTYTYLLWFSTFLTFMFLIHSNRVMAQYNDIKIEYSGGGMFTPSYGDLVKDIYGESEDNESEGHKGFLVLGTNVSISVIHNIDLKLGIDIMYSNVNEENEDRVHNLFYTPRLGAKWTPSSNSN